jgi:hypothetical protein
MALGIVSSQFSSLCADVADLLQPNKNVFLVQAKPFYKIFHLRYLEDCGISKNAVKEFMDILYELHHLHGTVLGNDKRDLTMEDLGAYFLIDDVFTNTRRNKIATILQKVRTYLKSQGNNIPVIDPSHAYYMRGLSRFYLCISTQKYQGTDTPDIGHVMNFYAVLGEPSPMVVVPHADSSPLTTCNESYRNYKTFGKNASQMLGISEKYFSGSMLNMNVVPRVDPTKKAQILDNLKKAIEYRYKYAKAACVRETSTPFQASKKNPVFLHDVYQLISMLCRLPYTWDSYEETKL